jgi:hypothetical protein
MPHTNTTHRRRRILVALVASLALAPTGLAASGRKSKDKDKDRAGDGDKPARRDTAARKISWANAVILEPVALTFAPDSAPAIQLQHALDRDYDHPNSLALTYWGATFDSTDDSHHPTDPDPDSVIERHDRRRIFGVSARYMFYLTRSFHFNFGGGFRSTATEERAILADGSSFTVKKSATSLGVDIGLGNRWVLPNGLVLGGTWFQHFIPVAVVQSKDAKIPDGYEDGGDLFDPDSGGAKNDGMTMTFRIAADIGYAW